ncbi:MAG: hypothetical protein ACI84C_000489 [Flavobacteriales bacterium]
MRSTYLPTYLIVLALLLLISCAVIKPRAGGEKDSTPPLDSIYSPVNLSTQFTKNSFSIEFDEYFQTKDVQNQLVISPPLDGKPAVRIKKKTLYVSWEDTLKANTTYSFNFGESISDYNEGNVAQNLTYVFSTGDEVDSLQMQGTVRDAYTQEPVQGIKVMVYRNLSDSASLKEKPYYLAISDDLGEYTVNYMSAGTYNVVALADENGDYLVADGESLSYTSEPQELIDTILHLSDFLISRPLSSLQYIEDYSRDSTGFVKFDFLTKPDSLEFTVLGQSGLSTQYYFDDEQDSLFFWLLGEPIESDLELVVKAGGNVNDTISIQHYSISPASKMFSLELNHSDKVAARDSLFLNCGKYISQFDEQVNATLLKDSAAVPFEILPTSDPRKYWLKVELEDNSKYDLSIDPNKFTSLEGLVNDSMKIAISTYSTDHYGSLVLTIENLKLDEYSYILQLENRDGKVVREIEVEDALLTFNRILPGAHKIRIIVDRNENGEWDPVDFVNRQQPEQLFYFPKEFNMRSNWEMEFTWILDLH